ncbi:MAG: peptide chain release factor 1 [Bacteriovoracaceae bacterium]|jgi:peptide chain release factor 1|nr:peptide chain release factor 1 [Halobacteriovoraceae bacterium]MDP7320156.1 peptide chain release factor 1 [Bacteriovoracaceae bacterium]
MFDKLDEVVKRYEELTEKLADPTIYDRQKEFKQVSEERGNIEELVQCYQKYKKIKNDLDGAKEILETEKDADMREMAKEEVQEYESQIPTLEEELRILLLPKDPLDNKNCMVELRAGAGGDESSIFVADVWRMYKNYWATLGFKAELVSASESDSGYKEVILNVTGDKVYSVMKYESGVHRVQRVPETESQGRVHTSTITVAVMPEADDVEFELDMNDVRVDVYRSGGKGGQSVNTTDSAVRVTHLPTSTVVAIQDEKSQHKNKEKALKILKNRIFDKMVQEAHDEEAAKRKGLVGTGDRSERIRTYNFPQGRLTDHRIGLTLYSLDKIIEGDLAPVTDALIAHNQAQLLKGDED